MKNKTQIKINKKYIKTFNKIKVKKGTQNLKITLFQKKVIIN